MKKLNGDLLKTLSYANFDLIKHSILLGYRGSITHGTYIKNKDKSIDDKDIMGICVPPKEYYFGLKSFEQYEKFEGEWDVVIYSIKKMFNLLLKNNPNVLSLLWLPKNYYIIKTDLGQMIINNRKEFSSKQVYKSFCGYAYGQLHRMEHLACKGYMGEKRKKLVEKYGYDTKNAAHLIRLLKMGIEFLISEELNVLRPERAMLIEIKQGLWKLEDIKKMAKELFVKMEEAYIKTNLPNKPNYQKIDDLLINITRNFLLDKN
jgi:uncharacterized protein